MDGMKVSLPVKAIYSLFPLGALAALIVWLVYVARYGRDGDLKPNDEGQTNSQNSEIAFQTIVALSLLYFVFHHYSGMMML